MYILNTEISNFSSAARRQRQVFFAVMLRNIRTRFFGNGLGYVVGIAWPLSHIVIIVLFFILAGRTAPYGDSIALFIGTGVVPFMAFSYLARLTMLSVMRARPLLAFPEVKVLDVLLATLLLETLAASCVALTIMMIGWFLGIEVFPRDVVQAAYAFGGALLLGFGFGLLNGVLALAFPAWFTGYALINIVLWVTSGVVFVPDALPELARDILVYHPVLQVIEWMRSAYYEGYGSIMLDRSYTIGFGVWTVFLGLLVERMTRGHILALRA
jgi:capsular polysaccharide transport system permease protein